MSETITRESIISALKARGYQAMPNDAIKNGVHLSGIVIESELNMSPCFYAEDYIDHYESSEAIAEDIADYYEKHKTDLDIDTSILSDRDKIRDHLYVGMQKKSDEALVKRESEFDGIEEYLYIRINTGKGLGIIKLREEMIKPLSLSQDEAWESALKNISKTGETVISSIGNMMKEMTGFDYHEMNNLEYSMHILTNQSRSQGSAQILDKDAISRYFSFMPVKPKQLILIPSSIHEWLLIPTRDDNVDCDGYNSMIGFVNEHYVDPIDRLGDHCYLMDLEPIFEDKIS